MKSLEGFFRNVRFSGKAPGAVRAAAASDDWHGMASALADSLAARQRLRSLSTIAKNGNPYLWSLRDPHLVTDSAQWPIECGRTEEDWERGRNGRTSHALTLLAGAPSDGDSTDEANSPSAVLALLYCADLLARRPDACSPEQYLSALCELLCAASDAANPKDDLREAGLVDLVLRHGELPWTAALAWPEFALARSLAAAARRALGAGLARLCDHDGVPCAKHLPLLPLLLASFTRCLWLARETGQTLWNAADSRSWRALVLNALRLGRWDGKGALVFPAAPASTSNIGVLPRWDAAGIDTLLELTADGTSRAAWAAARGARSSRGVAPGAPQTSLQSDDARLAVLRTHWKAGASLLVVRHDRIPVELELSMRGQTVLTGPWHFQLQVDGRSLDAPSDCQAVCWMADEDLVYLELCMKWPGGLLLERQMLVGCQEPFVLLADSVKARRKCALTYTGTMPLAPGLSGSTDEPSRIGWVKRPGAGRIWLVPLGLEQRRVERAAGALEVEGDRVRLHTEVVGKGLYAPLLLHALPGRADSVEWRTLTVTQSRRVLRADAAIAYRVRFGPNRQLLLYRSLGPRGTRAVLGHQTKCEFIFGWFDRDGDLEPLLQVT